MGRSSTWIGPFELLRRPSPRLLWLSQIGSVAGDRLYQVALIWVTASLTGSPSAVAVVSLASTLPFLVVSLVSGAVADRRDPLALARSVDIARGFLVAAVPGAYVIDHLSVATLALVAGLLSGLEAFFLPSVQSVLPRLVAPQALTGMVSLLDSTDRLGRVLGPGLVGLLAIVVPEIHLFTLDALSFLLSAAALSLVMHRTPRPTPAPPEVGGRRAALTAGWRALHERAVLRDSVALRALCNLAWPTFTLAVPFVISQRFHHGIGGYGLVLAVFGAGNLLGNIASARINSHLARWCAISWVLVGLGFLALGAARTFELFTVAATAIGVCTPLANVTIDAHIAVTVPTHQLARAYTAQRLLVVSASAAGLPAAATLLNHGGPALALCAGGATITIVAMLATLRQMRESPA